MELLFFLPDIFLLFILARQQVAYFLKLLPLKLFSFKKPKVVFHLFSHVALYEKIGLLAENHDSNLQFIIS